MKPNEKGREIKKKVEHFFSETRWMGEKISNEKQLKKNKEAF